MTKYRVQLKTTAYAYVTVEADDPDAAIDAALEGEMPYICAQCSGWGAGYDLELDDAWQEPDADDVWEVES